MRREFRELRGSGTKKTSFERVKRNPLSVDIYTFMRGGQVIGHFKFKKRDSSHFGDFNMWNSIQTYRLMHWNDGSVKGND